MVSIEVGRMIITPTQFHPYSVSINVWNKNSEIFNWLELNYGPSGLYNNWDWAGMNTDRIFYFKNEKDKTLFLLRWS